MISNIDPMASELKPKLERDSINWDRPKLERFKKSLAVAKTGLPSKVVFRFDGYDFLIGYASYLVEYLESNLK